MGKNSKNNKKHTWTALVAIAHFLLPLCFSQKSSNLFFLSRSLPFACHSFFLFSLKPSNACCPSSLFCFPPKKKALIFSILRFFLYLYQPLKNSICWMKSTFLSSISLHFWKLEYLSLSFGELFPPMYAAKSISSFQEYFCLSSLSVHTFVRVDPPTLILKWENMIEIEQELL